MKKAAKSQRRTAKKALATHLEKRLKEYSLAAAGLGLIALAQPASAGIILNDFGGTPQPVGTDFTLNVGGVNVVTLINSFSGYSGNIYSKSLFAKVSGSNKLFFGAGSQPLQPGDVIPTGLGLSVRVNTAAFLASFDSSNFMGRNQLLGFGFATGTGSSLQKKHFYGWMALDVSAGSTYGPLNVQVDKYAYEACSGVSINAGQEEGGGTCAGTAETPEPGSLVLMGLGAAGLALLRARRKKQAA